MDDIFNINPKVSSALCIIIGYILIDSLTANEQNVVGNWLELTGQLLITNASAQSLIENRINGSNININSKEVKNIYNPFFYDIDKAKEIFKSEQISEETINKILKKINEIEKVLKNLKTY